MDVTPIIHEKHHGVQEKKWWIDITGHKSWFCALLKCVLCEVIEFKIKKNKECRKDKYKSESARMTEGICRKREKDWDLYNLSSFNKCMTQLKISDKKTHTHTRPRTHCLSHTLFPCTKTLFIPHFNSDLGSVGFSWRQNTPVRSLQNSARSVNLDTEQPISKKIMSLRTLNSMPKQTVSNTLKSIFTCKLGLWLD